MSNRFSTARAVMRFAAITILAGLSCQNDQPLGPKPLASLIVSSAQTTSQAPLPVTIVTMNEAGVELEGEVEAARAVLCLAGRDLSCATPLATVIEEGARLQLRAQVGGGYSRSLVRDVTVGPVHEGRTYHVGLDDRTTTVTTTPGTTRIEIVFAAAVVTIATVSQSGVDISGHISITSPEGFPVVRCPTAGCASPQVVTLAVGEDVVVSGRVVQFGNEQPDQLENGGTVTSVADGITYDIDAGTVTSTLTPGISRIEIRFTVLPVTIVTMNEAGVELEGQVESRAFLCLGSREESSCPTPLATVLEERTPLHLRAQVGGGYSRSLVRDVDIGSIHEGKTYHVGLDDRTTTVTPTPGITRVEIVFAAAAVTIATVSQSGVAIAGHISITSPEGFPIVRCPAAGCASPQVVTLAVGEDVVVSGRVVQFGNEEPDQLENGGAVASVADGTTYDIDAGIVTSTLTPGISRIEIRFGLPPNRPPIAHAGADGSFVRSSSLGASVPLDGSTSSDPDGDALSFKWREGSTLLATTAQTTVTLGLGTHTLTLEVTDRNGGANTDDVIITVLNSAPTADVGGPYVADEGVSVSLSLSGTDIDGSAMTFSWDLGDGTKGSGASPPSSHVYADGPVEHTIVLSVLDADGGTDTKNTTVTVANVAPQADFGFPPTTAEGSSFTLSLSNIRDVAADLAGLQFRFDCGDGLLSTWGDQPRAECATVDNGSRSIRAEIRDKDGGSSVYAGSVVVSNVPPVLGPVNVPLDPVPLGGAVRAFASFTDPGTADTHEGFVQWDVGLAFEPAYPGVDEGAKTVVASRPTDVGVYTISLRVRDDDGGEDTKVASSYVVVYDPSAGFVTGGGWIMSPAGAYAPNLSVSGKATFGFVARYQKGASLPSGNTEFQFQLANLKFQSTSYQWLVVGGAKAQFKGEGTINGASQVYGFLMTAIDGEIVGGGGADRFRIKIWDKQSGSVVYDNQRSASEESDAATLLSGGSIVIHKS